MHRTHYTHIQIHAYRDFCTDLHLVQHISCFIWMATGGICQRWIPMSRNLCIQTTCKLNLNLDFIFIFQPILFLHESTKETHSKYVRKLKSIQSNKNSCNTVRDNTREIQLISFAAAKEKFTLIWKPNNNKEHRTGTSFYMILSALKLRSREDLVL